MTTPLLFRANDNRKQLNSFLPYYTLRLTLLQELFIFVVFLLLFTFLLKRHFFSSLCIIALIHFTLLLRLDYSASTASYFFFSFSRFRSLSHLNSIWLLGLKRERHTLCKALCNLRLNCHFLSLNCCTAFPFLNCSVKLALARTVQNCLIAWYPTHLVKSSPSIRGGDTLIHPLLISGARLPRFSFLFVVVTRVHTSVRVRMMMTVLKIGIGLCAVVATSSQLSFSGLSRFVELVVRQQQLSQITQRNFSFYQKFLCICFFPPPSQL